jgi:hypothetical protein
MTQAPWTQAPPQGPPPQNGWQPPAPQGYAGPPAAPQGWQQAPQAPPANQGWQQGAPPQQVPQGPPPPAGPPQGTQGGQPWQQTPQAPPPQAAPQEEGDDEFFTGGTGGSYMSFADDSCVGHPRGGTIVGINERQQTHKKTKEPQFWPNSDRPIMIKVVTMQTNERKPGDQEDQGLRSVWLPQSKDVTKAVIEAMRVSTPNEMRLKLGGQLWITRTGSRQTKQQDGSAGFPAFTYTAHYTPPQENPNDGFFTGPPPNGQAAPQQAGLPPQAAPQPGPAAQTPWQQGPTPQQGNAYATANGQQGWSPQGQAAPQAGPPQGGWQQGPPAPQQGQPQGNGQAPWAQQGPPQTAPQASANGQAPWSQPPPAGPPQGGWQPAAPDPANPWGNQQGQQYPQQ